MSYLLPHKGPVNAISVIYQTFIYVWQHDFFKSLVSSIEVQLQENLFLLKCVLPTQSINNVIHKTPVSLETLRIFNQCDC